MHPGSLLGEFFRPSDQISFTDVECANCRRVSRREQFLETMRRFLGLDFTVEQVPDATTLLHFGTCWRSTV